MVRSFVTWFTRGIDGQGRASAEAIFLRVLGSAYMVLFVAETIGTRPHPGVAGKGLVVLLAMVALIVCVFATMPRCDSVSTRQPTLMLLGVGAASAVLAGLQPHGIWQAGPYFVGIVAAMRLQRVRGLVTLGLTLVAVIAVSTATGHSGQAVSVALGAVPWFLVMRLMAELRHQRDQLARSREAEARAAAEAERGRIAREMHDVLAHSLSALALQLESGRLLARARGTDPEVTEVLDQAHHLAASGLEEARRAIAAARGDELPGPERLPSLVEAFEEQSGIPTSLSVTGEPRELPPDGRLAVYRTAQEALTNIRRHATPERVEVQLRYANDAMVLVVEDPGAPGTPPPAKLSSAGGGFGLNGMRERAELLGGKLSADPTADGFRVELWLPFARLGRELPSEHAVAPSR